MKLLLVEDDNSIAQEIKRALLQEDFDVRWKATGQGALDAFSEFQPDILILDLGLPDIDGGQVLTQIRQKDARTPILILTARDAMASKVASLDSGADDYLIKPFEMPELLARLRVLGRRISATGSSEIHIGPVTLNLSSHTVSIDGNMAALSRREYRVLSCLMENASRIQTKEMIESRLYGWGEEVASNTIEVHISNLRKKLPTGFIQTVRGVGYLVDKSFSLTTPTQG